MLAANSVSRDGLERRRPQASANQSGSGQRDGFPRCAPAVVPHPLGSGGRAVEEVTLQARRKSFTLHVDKQKRNNVDCTWDCGKCCSTAQLCLMPSILLLHTPAQKRSCAPAQIPPCPLHPRGGFPAQPLAAAYSEAEFDVMSSAGSGPHGSDGGAGDSGPEDELDLASVASEITAKEERHPQAPPQNGAPRGRDCAPSAQGFF